MVSMIFMLFVTVLISMVMINVPMLIMNNNSSNKITYQPFECGIESMSLSRSSYSMQFFIIAIIFVIFDLEIVFLLGFIPTINWMNLMMIQVLLMLMFLGLIYELKYNKLTWVK